jgi:hypothetical protein
MDIYMNCLLNTIEEMIDNKIEKDRILLEKFILDYYDKLVLYLANKLNSTILLSDLTTGNIKLQCNETPIIINISFFEKNSIIYFEISLQNINCRKRKQI